MQNPKKTGIRAKIIEFYRRLTPVGRDNYKNLIYFNGDNNLYPYEIETAINASPTAFRSAMMMKKFISGRGLVDTSKDVFVDAQQKVKLSSVITDISEDIAYHKGCFVHVGYNAALKPATLKVMDYVECRTMKKDDEGNDGKIVVHDWIGDSKKNVTKEKKFEIWFYPFNRDPKVIAAQIRRDNGLSNEDDITAYHVENYRGQIYYINLTPKYKYALSPLNPVYDDASSEAEFAVYTNNQMRRGFVGKTIVFTSGLDEEGNEQAQKTVDDWLGSGSAGIAHISVSSGQDLEKTILVKQLEAQFDDKLFESTDKRIRRNIMGCFNNVPPALIESSDGSLFGTSGETYYQMKLFYSEQTEDERYQISEVLTVMGFPCEIEPIVRPPKTTEEIKDAE